VKAQRHERASKIEKEDPRQNGYRTKCTTAVLKRLGVTNFKYCQTQSDVVSILRRHDWSVRSRRSQVGKISVGSLRKKLRTGRVDAGEWLVVFVDQHVLLIDRAGRTVVDTDPRQRDRRKIRAIYAIWDR